MSWIATGAAALSVIGGISKSKADEKARRIQAAQESLSTEMQAQDVVQSGKQAGRSMKIGAEESRMTRDRERAKESTRGAEGASAAALARSMRDTMAPVGARTAQFSSVLGTPTAAPGGMFRAGTAGNVFADVMRGRASAASGFNTNLAGTYGALTAAEDQAISEGGGVADAMRTAQRGAASRDAVDTDVTGALRRTGFEKYKLPVEQAEYKKAQSDIYAPYVRPHFVRESSLGKYAGMLGDVLGAFA